MSDEIETTTVETTADSPLINKPHVSPKPYDDDIFEAYEESAPSEEVPEVKETVEEAKEEDSEILKPEDQPEAKEEKEPQTEPDKIEDVEITRPINGKEVKFKVRQAIEAFAKQEEFNRNMDRRVTHISQREKAWKESQDNFKGHISSVISATKTGNFVESIRALAKLAAGDSDLDVTAFEKQYFEQLDKVSEIYRKMTPEQQEAYFAKRALEEERERNKKFVERDNFEKSKSELQRQVESAMQSNSLTPDEFWGNYKTLIDNQVGEGKRFASQDEVTAEEVVAYSNEIRQWEKVYSAGEIAKIEDEAILEELKRVASVNPDWTAEDLATVLQKSGLGVVADKDVVGNLNRKAGSSRFSQGSSTKKQNGKIEGLEQEDLDFLYRNQPKTYSRPRR